MKGGLAGDRLLLGEVEVIDFEGREPILNLLDYYPVSGKLEKEDYKNSDH